MTTRVIQFLGHRCGKLAMVTALSATSVASIFGVGHVAYADVSQGSARLISQGLTVTNYPFTTEQKVTINTVNVTMLVNATVAPATLSNTLKQLKQVSVAKANFDLTSLAQHRTQTGLIQISAQLSSDAPLTALPSIYQFAERSSKSGWLYNVATIVPYRSQVEKQQTLNKMSQTLYQQASDYAKSLGSGYRIAEITYRSPRYINNNSHRPMMLGALNRSTTLNGSAKNSEATPMLMMKEDVQLTANVTFVRQDAK